MRTRLKETSSTIKLRYPNKGYIDPSKAFVSRQNSLRWTSSPALGMQSQSKDMKTSSWTSPTGGVTSEARMARGLRPLHSMSTRHSAGDVKEPLGGCRPIKRNTKAFKTTKTPISKGPNKSGTFTHHCADVDT